MTDRPKSPLSTPCPDLEAWCGYVEGSVDAGLKASLTQHLAACDRCFAAVAQVRRSLEAADASAGGEPSPAPRRRPPARSRVARTALAAAAVVALVWVGLWQLRGSPPAPSAPAPEDARLGFAGRGVGEELESERGRALVVFSQFSSPETTPVPGWARDVGLASLCDPLPSGVSGDGVVLGRRFTSRLPAAAYRTGGATPTTLWSRYLEEILRQVDDSVDFADFDGDGDGVADLVLVLVPAPPGFLAGDGAGDIGLGVDYSSADTGALGVPVQVSPTRCAVAAEGADLTAQALCGHLSRAAGLRSAGGVR